MLLQLRFWKAISIKVFFMKLHRLLKTGQISILIFLLSLNGCSKSPEQHFNQAQILAQKGDHKAAIIELKTVLQTQPNNSEARQLLGRVFLKTGAYANAEKEFSKALNLGASNPEVFLGLAQSYLYMGEPTKTLALKIPESGLNPRSTATIHNLRAQAYLMLNNRADAERSIAAAGQADSSLPELILTRAKLALADKQKDKASLLLDESLKADPALTEALYIKAALLEAENKDPEADLLYQRIIKNDSKDIGAHLGRANLKIKKGDFAAADTFLKEAEKIAGKAPVVQHARGILELRRGKLEAASNAFLEVLRVAPDHLPTMLAYAMTTYGQAHYEQSISYAGKVLGASPGNVVATKILVNSHLKNGNVQGALKTLDAYIAKYPNDPDILALAGNTYLRAGNKHKASEYLDKAAKLAPENVSIKTRQAAVHLAIGDNSKAIAVLEVAAGLSNKPSEADLALVMLHMKSKEYDKALLSIAGLEKKIPRSPIPSNLRAAALLGKRDRLGARKALEQAQVLDPKFVPAAVNLANMDLQDKRPDLARKRIEAVLNNDKQNTQAMMAMAEIAGSQNARGEYIAWLDKAIKTDPKSIEAYTKLVRYYFSVKDNQKAFSTAQIAYQSNPDNILVMNLLGVTQMSVGDYNAAVSTFKKMLEKAPESHDVYLRLGLAYEAGKQTTAARDAFNHSLKIKPDYLAAQDNLIRLELADNKPEAALKIARAIQMQNPKSSTGFDREADIMFSLKRYPEAIQAYETALTKQPSSTGIIKLHRALSDNGETNKAEQKIIQWLNQKPNDLTVRTYAAEMYFQNRPLEAIEQYQSLLKISPDNAVAFNNLANLYQRQKNYIAARQAAEKALSLAPGHPGILDTLGWILVEQNQIPRALGLLNHAVTKAPTVPLLRYHYGVALARAGKNSEAKKELSAAIENGLKAPELEYARASLKSL